MRRLPGYPRGAQRRVRNLCAEGDEDASMRGSAALSTVAVGACDEPTAAVGKAVLAAPRRACHGLLRQSAGISRPG
jgi:hypothetical protein